MMGMKRLDVTHAQIGNRHQCGVDAPQFLIATSQPLDDFGGSRRRSARTVLPAGALTGITNNSFSTSMATPIAWLSTGTSRSLVEPAAEPFESAESFARRRARNKRPTPVSPVQPPGGASRSPTH